MIEKKIIIVIDRDNDIGEKAGINGPIIGESENLRAANALMIADPSDTDANTIFAALKLKKEHPAYQIATITGDKRVGVVSDEKIAEQLKKVVEKTNATKAVIVTDGAEDEFILPIIQSKMEIISITRVIVEQNERLEGTYYIVKNFINNIVDDRRLAKVFLGLPAVALILIALFGAEGWRIVLGAVGLFLFVKGFKLEKAVVSIGNGLSATMERGKISFFLYALGVVFILIGCVFGYYNMRNIGDFDMLTSTLAFLYGSVYIFLIAGVVIWAGAALFAYSQNKLSPRLTTILALFFAIVFVTHSATEVLLQPELGVNPLISAIIVGFVVLAVALVIEHASEGINAARRWAQRPR